VLKLGFFFLFAWRVRKILGSVWLMGEIAEWVRNYSFWGLDFADVKNPNCAWLVIN
jgi:hypothetical protein